MGSSDAALRERYRIALTTNTSRDALCRLLLLEGLPHDANALSTAQFGRCSLRGLVWKALLGVGIVEVDEYATFVQQGPSSDDSRVREDARRTFSNSEDFIARVPNEKIIRLLNAYVRACGNKRGVYAQSMSLLAAPFLYVMPEPDAFHCFRIFLQQKVPLYVKRYSAAHEACALLDKCLSATEPDLHKVLANHGLKSELYAFSSISSLGACVQPMSDTVRLWDILLAFGIHMHILFTLARLLISGPNILETAKKTAAAPLTTREMEQGLGLDAETVLARAVPLTNQLDPDLYSELLAHANHPSTPSSRDDSDPSNYQDPFDNVDLETVEMNLKDVSKFPDKRRLGSRKDRLGRSSSFQQSQDEYKSPS